MIGSMVIRQLYAAVRLYRGAALRILFFWVPVTYTVCLFRPFYHSHKKNISGMKKHPTKFPGYYITEDGKVFREPTKYDNTNDLIEVGQHPRGGVDPEDRYMSVNISLKDERGKTLKQIKYYTHRLIAETLIENPKNLSEVDHINRDKKDNSVDNLRWVNRKENWICPEHGPSGKWLKLKNFPEV